MFFSFSLGRSAHAAGRTICVELPKEAYITIFGNFIGERIGEINGLAYIQFIIPGLIIMPIISNSYMNVVGSFYSGRFQKSIEELL